MADHNNWPLIVQSDIIITKILKRHISGTSPFIGAYETCMQS